MILVCRMILSEGSFPSTLTVNLANWSYCGEITRLPELCRRDWGVWGCQRLLSEGWFHGCPEVLQLQGQGTASTATAGIPISLHQSLGTGGRKSSSTRSTLCSIFSCFAFPLLHKGAPFFHLSQGQLLQAGLPCYFSTSVPEFSVFPPTPWN